MPIGSRNTRGCDLPYVTVAFTRGYNNADQPTTLTDGTSTRTTGYNSLGQMATISLTVPSVSAPSVAFTYDAAGRLGTVTRKQGSSTATVASAYTFDDANRLTAIGHSSNVAGSLVSLGYSYDDADRLTGYSGPEGSKGYGYDKTNQLTSVTGANAETFSYDANGNRTMTGYATGTGNRLLSDGANDYTYDDNGNTLTKTRLSDNQYTEYAWDHRNRLVSAEVYDYQGGTLIHSEQYVYDVLDRRIGVTVDDDGAGSGSAVTRWTEYDGANEWADADGSGSIATRYLAGPGMDERYGRVDAAGAVAWYLSDNVNSVRAVVATDGTVKDAISYTAFGSIASESSPTLGDRFKYTGREWDAGVGQYYYRVRYYNSNYGLFFSENPIRLQPGNANLYRYVNSAPTINAAPTGLLLQTGIQIVPQDSVGFAMCGLIAVEMQSVADSIAVIQFRLLHQMEQRDRLKDQVAEENARLKNLKTIIKDAWKHLKGMSFLNSTAEARALLQKQILNLEASEARIIAEVAAAVTLIKDIDDEIRRLTTALIRLYQQYDSLKSQIKSLGWCGPYPLCI